VLALEEVDDVGLVVLDDAVVLALGVDVVPATLVVVDNCVVEALVEDDDLLVDDVLVEEDGLITDDDLMVDDDLAVDDNLTADDDLTVDEDLVEDDNLVEDALVDIKETAFVVLVALEPVDFSLAPQTPVLAVALFTALLR